MGVALQQDLVICYQGSDIHPAAVVVRIGIERSFGHDVDEIALYRLVPYAARVARSAYAFNGDVLGT